MKTVSTYSPARIILLFIALVLCIGWTNAWEEMMEDPDAVTCVKADFIQEKHLKLLSRPLISKGVFFFQSPGSLRWEYQTPVRSVLLMHKGKVERYIEGSRGVVRDSGVKLQAMQVVLQEISQFLSGNFQDNPNFKAEVISDFKVSLVPEDPAMEKIIQRIELFLSETPGVIDEVKIFESRDSYTRLIFENTRLNETIEERIFQEM